MENRRYLLNLFALFLVLSHLLPLSAVPLSRNLALKNQNLPAEEIANQAIPIKEETNLGEKMARMDIEINDYPGSGANPRHDPRSPGRA
ncbi:hypothetical protein FCM35_KLT03990 [Carex littledalei]|uniref:Uncharacterized protein n=1 Tax=Carex littledalei TaxID=544730 RepID=A0A833R6C6_9POAL|nr:hypothetical protein FCM35_KLT03990 [Carex littledalei]